MDYCIISALNPSEAGPVAFTYGGGDPEDESDLTNLSQELAAEVVSILGQGADTVASVQAILEEALLEFVPSADGWLKAYTGRDMVDKFYDTGVLIGPQAWKAKVELRRVEGFSYDDKTWDTVVVDCGGGKQERTKIVTRYGGRGAAFFCWERPYLYLREWMRHSCPQIALWDDATFVEQFFRLVQTDHGDCLHRRDAVGLLPCISYGGLEKIQEDGGFQETFQAARSGVKQTAAAIAAGARGRNLWQPLALDFGAWMVTRPDLWPTPTSDPPHSSGHAHFEPGTPTVFHALPPEVLIQILPLLPLSDLFSIQLLSRGVAALVSPLLDETLWHHVHCGDLYWILPVTAARGDLRRANRALMKWLPKPRRVKPTGKLACVLGSKDFPFSKFLRECLKLDSMRNRERLWKITQQYRTRWETMGFDV